MKYFSGQAKLNSLNDTVEKRGNKMLALSANY